MVPYSTNGLLLVHYSTNVKLLVCYSTNGQLLVCYSTNSLLLVYYSNNGLLLVRCSTNGLLLVCYLTILFYCFPLELIAGTSLAAARSVGRSVALCCIRNELPFLFFLPFLPFWLAHEHIWGHRRRI